MPNADLPPCTAREFKTAFKTVQKAVVSNKQPKEVCPAEHLICNKIGASFMRPFLHVGGMCGKCGEVPGSVGGFHTDGTDCPSGMADCTKCARMSLGMRYDSTEQVSRDYRWHNEAKCGWGKVKELTAFIFESQTVAQNDPCNWLTEQPDLSDSEDSEDSDDEPIA